MEPAHNNQVNYLFKFVKNRDFDKLFEILDEESSRVVVTKWGGKKISIGSTGASGQTQTISPNKLACFIKDYTSKNLSKITKNSLEKASTCLGILQALDKAASEETTGLRWLLMVIREIFERSTGSIAESFNKQHLQDTPKYYDPDAGS